MRKCKYQKVKFKIQCKSGHWWGYDFWHYRVLQIIKINGKIDSPCVLKGKLQAKSREHALDIINGMLNNVRIALDQSGRFYFSQLHRSKLPYKRFRWSEGKHQHIYTHYVDPARLKGLPTEKEGYSIE